MGCASPRRSLPGCRPAGQARAPVPTRSSARAWHSFFGSQTRATDFQRTIYTGLHAVLQIFSMILAVRSGAIIRSNIGSWGAP